MLAKYKEAGQLVGSVPSARKRKRGTGKGREESVATEKLGIEKGDTPKGYDARVLVIEWDKRAQGYWEIHEDPALDMLEEGMLR